MDDLADAGTDDGTAVTNYGGPAHFSGHLEKVKIETHRGGVTSQADGKKEGEMKKTE